jgi:hypothetical protein
MNKMSAIIKTIFITVAGLSMGSCDRMSGNSQFQVISTSSGELYRLQSSTGAMHRISGATLVRVSETDRVQLQVGAVYVLENGSNIKYLGEGKFESFKPDVLTLDEYIKAQEKRK